ncbi:MAG: amidohydrolase family protein, partial [Pseudomonadota bacterium]|nr:amidohydrolase family protein [Pseudomonadota bacterium]
MARYDILIEGGRYFDGTGAPSAIRHVAIQDHRIALVSETPIPHSQADRVIDAAGKWVMPGFLDTHTHYDAEFLVSPSLSESVRHGVTTVLVGSCSLSMICSEAEDASDIFTRVETVPRERVLPILTTHKTWSTPKQWVEHVKTVPLGPNVISFLGHSDLRVGVMGLNRATDHSVQPTEEEMRAMESLLDEAL